MPIKKNNGEGKKEFIARCMSAESDKFPDEKQRYAVCVGYWTDSEIGDKMQSMIKFRDTADIGKTKKTQEGYLVATSRVARTGVQLYRAGEIGDAAIDAGYSADSIVRVYRAPDQVFHKDTLASITRVPVTLDHPPEMVDAENYSEYAVGDVGDAYSQDGDWIVVNPMIKDADAVKAAATTHKEISMGYTANIVPARDGVDADFEMIDIRMNHLAIVPKGRAGSQARIGDAQLWGASPVTVEDKNMTVELKTVILGDKAVQVEAKDADTVAAILKDHKAAIDVKDESIGELKAKLKDAEDKVATFDAAVDAAVAARDMREKVIAAFGDEAIKGASDAEITGMFKVIDKAVNDSARDAIKNKQTKVEDAWGDIIAKMPTYKKESK